jgi:hypothetical protein
MVALNSVDERTLKHGRSTDTRNYVAKPLTTRVLEVHDYIVRLAIQKEINCGCDGILIMSCPACDDAMECQCELHPDRECTACLRCRTSSAIWAKTRGEDEALPF